MALVPNGPEWSRMVPNAAHFDYAFSVANQIGANFIKGDAPPRLFYCRDMVVEGKLPPLHAACAFGTSTVALPLIATATAEELWRTVIVRGKNDNDGIKFQGSVYTAGRCARERLSVCSNARVYRIMGGREPFIGDQERLSEALLICDAIKKRAVELGAPWGDLATFDLMLLDCAPRVVDSEMRVLLSQPQVLPHEFFMTFGAPWGELSTFDLKLEAPRVISSQQSRERRASLIAAEEFFMSSS